MKPTRKPSNPCFSSGPAAKFPGWSLDALRNAPVGRSHRSRPGKEKLKEAIDRSRDLLGIPAEYRVGIVPASDTGAVEMAMWNLLGPLGVDVLAWESFGEGWAADAEKQLKLSNLRIMRADYGKLPDLHAADCDRDVVFTWNGTTSGVRVPDADWIDDDRQGLTICDATSAVFAVDMPWEKLDVTTWSWQKAMGGEGGFGMIALGPRAVERLEGHTPAWPVPKIFQLAKKGKPIEGIFAGETINTPSMLAVEDALAALRWIERIGGLNAMIRRSMENYKTINAWIERTPWAAFLAEAEETRSTTSICMKIVDPWYEMLDDAARQEKAGELAKLLEREGAAYDIGSYRDAPPGIRVWGGGTVENSDIQALLPWLDWAFAEIKNHRQAA